MGEASQPGDQMLDLNAHCGGGGVFGPNAWENPSLTGMHRLPPHSKNIRKVARSYYDYRRNLPKTQRKHHPSGPQPCVCLDSPGMQDGCVREYENIADFADSTIRIRGGNEELKSEHGWKFRLFPDPMSIPANYILPAAVETTADLPTFCSQRIKVPSNWTMDDSSHRNCCGVYDPPRYTNVQMPFDVLYPHVPESNPTGVYRLDFSALPLAWLKNNVNGTQVRRRVVLHFAGVDACFFVYINGHFVGMGKDSRLPSEFDVTPCINHHTQEEGEGSTMGDGGTEMNTLVVVVLKWCDGTFLEQQDHWRGMAGIHRSVFLYSTPAEAYIEDVFCRAKITNLKQQADNQSLRPLQKGVLEIQARIGRDDRTRIRGRNIYYNEEIECARSDGVTYRLVFQVFDSWWKPLFEKPIDPSDKENTAVRNAHFRSSLISFQLEIPGNIWAWSDERPTLYRLRATLVRIDSTSADVSSEIDVYNCCIGFRNIEISNRHLLVNGQPVLIKGVVSESIYCLSCVLTRIH
jgi:beta-galactosidase